MNKNQSRSTYAVLLVSMAFAASANADGVKVGGAVEAGYSWANSPSSTTSGVSVKQSNFDFSGEFGHSSFMIDVPFTYNTATNTNMSLGATLSQAWVAHKAESGFRWKVGMFDTQFNGEANDLARVFFASHNLVYGNLPATHTGWTLGYGSGNWGLDILIGNTRDTSASVAGTFWDYGAKFSMNSDKNMFGLGFLYNGTTNNTYMLIDASGEFTFGKIMLDIEAMYKSVNTGTATNTIGVVAGPQFTLNDSWDLGLRLDFVSSSGAATTSQLGVTVGPNWNLSKNALMKFNYGLISTTAGSSTLSHGIVIDGVIRL